MLQLPNKLAHQILTSLYSTLSCPVPTLTNKDDSTGNDNKTTKGPEPENSVFSGFCQLLSRLEGVLIGVSGGKAGKAEKGKGQNYDQENVLEGKIQEKLKVSNRDY